MDEQVEQSREAEVRGKDKQAAYSYYLAEGKDEKQVEQSCTSRGQR